MKEIRIYIGTFISGEIYADYPEAKDKDRIIEIVEKYPINSEAKSIFQLLEKTRGFSYRFRLLE